MNIDATHLISQFEHAPEGIILTNGDGKIILINPVAQRIFGYSKNEVVTQKKKIRHVNETQDKQKELNEIKSRFVSMASHEFRTPLSTILSSASLVSKYYKTEDQDKRDRHIKKIKDSVRHLNNLLEDFLSFGKLEEGKIQVVPGPIDLKEFLEEVVEEMKTGIRAGQQFIVSCDSNSVFKSDKDLLKNILLNLLSNASKFSAEGAAIWIKAAHGNNKLALSIKDEGIGIAAEDMPHMFTSFYRGRNAVNIQGTGLGLHIVKRYVELLHGDIRLDSKLHEGTTVNFELPDLQEIFHP